jgi:hypothetical protein
MACLVSTLRTNTVRPYTGLFTLPSQSSNQFCILHY